MEKLHKKIFFLVFGILTTVLTAIILISSYKNYSNEMNNISETLQRVDRVRPNMFPPIQDFEEDLNNKRENVPEKIFIDVNVYTITLDSDMNPKDVVNNNGTDDTLTEETINLLLENYKKNTHKNNLFFSNYAYMVSKDKQTMYVIDITSSKEKIESDLLASLIIFVIFEIIIIIISKILADWITKPVEETFNKQKEFITDASHELKTPLAVITSNIDMIEGKKEDKKWIDNIKNESDRMNKLIINLLDLAKLENDNNLKLSTINLSKTLEKSILPFEGIMYEKKIKLSYDIEDNIEYLCNEDQIKELIVILIDNAIKHSKGKVITNLKKDKKTIIMEVTNSGDPIPKGEEEKIFERFYKVDKSRNREDNNYGIGLAIAKSIVEKHNGEIKAESEKGLTTFKVTFKIK